LEDLFARGPALGREWARYPKFCGFREQKMRLTRFGSRILRRLMQIGRGRIAEMRASVDPRF
jgi:hypothetical protein